MVINFKTSIAQSKFGNTIVTLTLGCTIGSFLVIRLFGFKVSYNELCLLINHKSSSEIQNWLFDGKVSFPFLLSLLIGTKFSAEKEETQNTNI